MSLRTWPSDILDFAVLRSIVTGFAYVVAADNRNEDACTVSPARVPQALTVGASGGWQAPVAEIDVRAPYSNKGPCVDLFAPGTNIPSDYNTNDYATLRASGTSLATPFAAGLAAQLLEYNSTLNPLQVNTTLDAWAVKGVLSDVEPDTPNKLLHAWYPGAIPPGNQAPLANFHTSCIASTHRCKLDGQWSIDDEPVSALAYRWTAVGRTTKYEPLITRFGGLEMSPDSYLETLTVTDRGGLSAAETRRVRIP